MNRFLIMWCYIVIFVWVTIAGITRECSSAEVNGTISLPDGEVNSQNLDVWIYCYTNGWSLYDYNLITIPEGNNSAEFSFDFPQDNQISCQYYLSGQADRHYITYGYYSKNGTTTDYSSASWISTNAPTEHIYLSLLPGVSISGTISLPDGSTYPESVNGSVSIYGLDGSWIRGQSYSIPSGQSAVAWQSTIPKSNQEVFVEVTLNKYQYNPDPIYLDSSYYNSNGSVGLREHATPLSSLADQENINITLLKGKVISGTINLVSPDVFSDNVYISLNASWGNSGYSNSVTTTAGQSSASFALAVPPDAPDYRLIYHQWGASPKYVNTGYYSNGEWVFCESEATLLASGIDHPGVNIPLLQNHTVQGTVSLPGATTEPVDIPIALGALYLPSDGQYDTTLSGRYQSVAVLPASTNSTPYEVVLPPICSDTPGSYLLGYNQNNEHYVRFGYYNQSGTVGLISNSDLLASGQSHTGIDLQLLGGNQISGTITLPNGAVAPPEGLPVTIGTLQEPNGLFHTTLVIAPGATSGPYTIRVAPDVGEVALGYWLLGDTPYATRGYFSDNATSGSKVTGRYGFADHFATATNNYSDIDFVLDPGDEVSGTIFTPAPAVNDTPIVVTLAADPADPATVYWHTVIHVDAGSQVAPYSQRIVLDSDIVAKYSNSENPQWTPAGYYFNSTNSVRSIAQATHLTADTDHGGVDFILDELLRGDVNYSGAVDLSDAILALQVLTGMTLSDDISKLADVNGDGVISLPEVLYILNQL